MNIFLLLLAAIALVAIIAGAVELVRDGYHRAPDVTELVARLRDSNRRAHA